ncbi:MAG: hypothetical protein AB7E85_00700 [Pseudobdellovibrionaceae bacterium]
MTYEDRLKIEFAQDLRQHGLERALDNLIQRTGDQALKEAAIKAREAFVAMPQEVASRVTEAVLGLAERAAQSSNTIRQRSFTDVQDFLVGLLDMSKGFEQQVDGMQASAAGLINFVGTICRVIPGLEDFGRDLMQQAQELMPDADFSRYSGLVGEVEGFRDAQVNGNYGGAMGNAAGQADALIGQVFGTITQYDDAYSAPAAPAGPQPSPSGTAWGQ